MRRILTLIIALTACLAPALAQNNWDRIGIGAGVGYSPKADAVLFWEHETKYHNAWEVFLAGSLALDNLKGNLWTDNTKAWGAGAAWKPCGYRARNRYGSARIGVSLGAAPTDFLAGIHAGWQHSYAMRRGWQFYWQAGVDVMLPKRNDLFRVGAGIGIKMPVRIK